MATNRNIQMNYFNGVDYDVLNPSTVMGQINDWSEYVYGKDIVDDLLSSKKEMYYMTGTYMGTGANYIDIVFTSPGKLALGMIAINATTKYFLTFVAGSTNENRQITFFRNTNNESIPTVSNMSTELSTSYLRIMRDTNMQSLTSNNIGNLNDIMTTYFYFLIIEKI